MSTVQDVYTILLYMYVKLLPVSVHVHVHVYTRTVPVMSPVITVLTQAVNQFLLCNTEHITFICSVNCYILVCKCSSSQLCATCMCKLWAMKSHLHVHVHVHVYIHVHVILFMDDGVK